MTLMRFIIFLLLWLIRIWVQIRPCFSNPNVCRVLWRLPAAESFCSVASNDFAIRPRRKPHSSPQCGLNKIIKLNHYFLNFYAKQTLNTLHLSFFISFASINNIIPTPFLTYVLSSIGHLFGFSAQFRNWHFLSTLFVISLFFFSSESAANLKGNKNNQHFQRGQIQKLSILMRISLAFFRAINFSPKLK